MMLDVDSEGWNAKVTSRPIPEYAREHGEQVMAGPERTMPRARKTDVPKRPMWSGIKANLALMDRSGLVALIRDLYHLDAQSPCAASTVLTEQCDGRSVSSSGPRRGLS